MLIACVVWYLLCFQDGKAEKCCETVEDSELVMAFLVHRHGDRAPIEDEVFLSDNPEELARMSKSYGFGNLTDSGKARSFILGQFLRRRYDQLLSSCYNASDIFVRSTETGRSQMTATIAVTAVYSPKIFWTVDLELINVEMVVIPASEDPNLCLQYCPEFMSHIDDIEQNKNPEEMEIYDEVIDIFSKDLGFRLAKNPLVFYGLNDVFDTQESVGMPLTDRNRILLPTIRKGAGLAIDHLFGNPAHVPLTAGVLLKEFFDTADQLISGADIPRLRVLSAHDFNVYSFTAATRAVPRQGVPRYCSVYSLELRRCKNSGKYVVVPIYVRSPEEPEAYLEIEQCGVLCDYEKFRRLTAKNTMTGDEYRKRCNISDAGLSKKEKDTL